MSIVLLLNLSRLITLISPFILLPPNTPLSVPRVLLINVLSISSASILVSLLPAHPLMSARAMVFLPRVALLTRIAEGVEINILVFP